jgi:hypothetical protein
MKILGYLHVLKVRQQKKPLELGWNVQNELRMTWKMREDFLLNKKSQMLVMISMATDEMIRLVAMYPDVWFMDTTAGMVFSRPCI